FFGWIGGREPRGPRAGVEPRAAHALQGYARNVAATGGHAFADSGCREQPLLIFHAGSLCLAPAARLLEAIVMDPGTSNTVPPPRMPWLRDDRHSFLLAGMMWVLIV